MKKTLTVNLGGTVYHIDEDAYLLLDKYLANLKLHFRKEEGAEEIVKDIELRISELFSERVNAGYQVITIEYVEEVIARMGEPEELSGEDEKINSSDFNNNRYREQIRRKLYRNPDDKILGGIAGGLSAYMGWDSTLVRIVLIILLFIPYCPMIMLYIIAWILIPQASTAAEKLSMRGENITVENIGKTVTDTFEKVAGGVNDYINTGKPRSTFRKLGDVIVQVIGSLLKILLIFVAVILTPVLFVLIIAFIVLIFAALGLVTAAPGFIVRYLSPVADWSMIGPFPMALSGIAGVLLVGIPLASLVYMVLSSIFHWKSISKEWKWSLLILWIITLVSVVVLASWIGWPPYLGFGSVVLS